MIAISQLARQLHHAHKEAERERLYGAAPEQTQAVIAAPIEQWDDRKLMAILIIERSAVALDCVEHLKAPKKLWPRQEDFAELRAEGFAFKRPLAQYHELTPAGQREARAVAQMVARRFRLHHIYEQGTSYAATAKCTCGWFKSFERKWGGENGKLARAINEHLGGG